MYQDPIVNLVPLKRGRTITNSPTPAGNPADADLLALIVTTLDDGKAEDIVTIDLQGKSSIADHLVIASGRSTRQVMALADQVASKLKDAGHGKVPVEGKAHGDWVLLDVGDIIVHLFRPEVRSFYNLEKMWGAVPPALTPAQQA